MQTTAVVRQAEALEEQTQEVDNDNNSNNNANRQEIDLPTSSTAPKERPKKISKKQQVQNDLTEKILQLANKEEDQVDLELAAIGSKMKRKLTEDEIDELLDEINTVTRAFFARKQRRTEVASVSVQDSASTSTAARNVVSIPPPPLQRQPQIVQEEEVVESGDILFDMSGMQPMPQYNVQYVSDPNSNNTYMKLQ